MANTNYKLTKNTQLESVKDYKQYDPQLIFSINNPLDPTQRLEKSIRLWRSEPGTNEISESVLENQEKALRELIGDDSITFAATKEDAKDTDIRHYLEKKAPVEVEGIYQERSRGYYRIGEPQESSGNSAFRSRFEPKFDGYEYDFTGYDSKNQFVRTYEALDTKSKQAFDDKDSDFQTDHTRIWVSKKSGLQGVELTNPIVSAFFQTTNNYKDKDSVKPLTREKFLTALEKKLESASDEAKKESDLKVEEVKDLKSKLEQNPETVSFNDVLQLVGGTATPRLHEDLHTAVQKWITLGSRRALTFYVEHAPSKRVYRTSSLNTPKDFSAQQFGLGTSLEFFAGDMSRKDIVEFLTEANLVDFEEVIEDAVEKTLDGSIENLTQDNKVYDFMNYLFVNRRITTNSSNGMNDPLKMPTYINSFGDYYDEPLNDDVVEETTSEPTNEDIEDATSVIQEKEPKQEEKQAALTPDEKAEELESSKEEAKDNTNPWSGGLWDADSDPFS